MNGDIEGTDCCGCELHHGGILAGVRFPWDDDTGLACIIHCDCEAGLKLRFDDDAAFALSELTGRIVSLVGADDGFSQPHYVLLNPDGTWMSTKEGDAYVAALRADIGTLVRDCSRAAAKRPAPVDVPVGGGRYGVRCADPACERCPRIERGETCAPDCAGWVLDRRGRIEPCAACGLYIDEDAAEAADAWLREHCEGIAVRLCTTLDESRYFYAVMANDPDDRAPRYDAEAHALAADACARAGYIVAEGEG
jgi:hypothetical protein